MNVPFYPLKKHDLSLIFTKMHLAVGELNTLPQVPIHFRGRLWKRCKGKGPGTCYSAEFTFTISLYNLYNHGIIRRYGLFVYYLRGQANVRDKSFLKIYDKGR